MGGNHAPAEKGLIPMDKPQHCTKNHRKTSDILREIAHEKCVSLSMRELSDRLGNRGFGLILLLFALPNAIPLTERDGALMVTAWLFALIALACMGFLVAGYAWIVLQALGGIL